jgi:hydrogenase 3 maturation protease
VEVFLGGTAPENLTGEIKRFAPTHLVIIDAADLDTEPGVITVMDPENIGGTTFCTHSLPLKMMIDYLLDSFECHVTVIGIQPQSLEVGAPVSREVLDAVESLAAILLDALPR